MKYKRGICSDNDAFEALKAVTQNEIATVAISTVQEMHNAAPPENRQVWFAPRVPGANEVPYVEGHVDIPIPPGYTGFPRFEFVIRADGTARYKLS